MLQSDETPSSAAKSDQDRFAADLCARIRRGDESGFQAFYELWFDRALRTVQAHSSRDEAFCLDVVQDAMLKVVTRLPELSGRTELDAWMNATLRTCTLDRIRQDARRSARERRVAQEERVQVEGSQGPVPNLREDEVTLVSLRIINQLPLGVVGTVLSSSAAAVQSRLRRVLRRLREENKHDR